MFFRILIATLLLVLAGVSLAQNPRVLLDTDRGPLLLELDAVRAPNTVANFMRYVDEGVYNDTLIQRVVPNFIVQGGGFRAAGAQVTVRAAIASERNNGLINTPGTIAMALTGNPPNVNSATSDWFINTDNNPELDPNFTVFGRVIFGTGNLASINSTPIFQGSEQPIRIPLVRRASRVAAGGFPILALHSGAWFDPANPGKGYLIEVSQTAGSETGPIMVVSWYDFFEGRQIWLSGIAPFAWGDSQVTVPLQISSGAQFGAAFRSADVVSDANWGSITLMFSGCDSATFTYTSSYGNGSVPARSLTLPTGSSCVGN